MVHRGNGQEAIGHLQNAAKAAEEAQVLAILPMVWAGVSWGYYLLADFEASRLYARRSIDTQSTIGVGFYSCVPYRMLGMICLDSGDLVNAQHFCVEALNLARKNRERDTEAWVLQGLGRVLGAGDKSQHQMAEEHILESISILSGLGKRPSFAEGYFYLGDLYIATGQREKALETLKKAQGMFQEMGMDYWLSRTEKALEKLKA
jgi:tetratricopeptide (TPR) repeat protein